MAVAVSTIATSAGARSKGSYKPDVRNHFHGVDPMSRWAKSVPALCGFSAPFNSISARAYVAGKKIDDDVKRLPSADFERVAAYVEVSRGQWGTLNIATLYDPVHKIAAVREYGEGNLAGRGAEYNDFYAFVADAARPNLEDPNDMSDEHVGERDLSSTAMGGKVHLGDTLAKVVSALGAQPALLSTEVSGCKGFKLAAFCSWSGSACKCPYDVDLEHETLGTVVFRADRVVAMAWERLACGAGL